MPVQYVLQATSIERLQEVLPEFMKRVYESPVFQMADVDLKFSKPEARIAINRDKANLLGVSTRNIAQTLQYGLSGQRLGYFYMNGKQYEILAEINRQQRNKPADLKSIYVRSDKGEMIQLDNLITLEENVAPPQLYHYNPFSVGYGFGRTGEGEDDRAGAWTKWIGIAEADARRRLPHGAGRRLEGVPRKLVEPDVRLHPGRHADLPDPRRAVRELQGPAGHHADRAAGHCRRAGVHGGQRADDEHIQPDRHHHADRSGRQDGILIVEFANQKQDAGLNKREAIEQASLQRLRPILMTSASTILGLLPLTVASGEGAQGRIAMGIAVVGGMVVSTLLTLYIVPAIYSYVSTDRIRKTKKNAK